MLATLVIAAKVAWDWIIAHWKLVLTVLGIILLLILSVSIYRCAKPVQKLNETEIQAAQKAIRDADAAEQRRILAENDKLVSETQANNDNAAQKTKEAEIKTAKAQEEIKQAAQRDYGSWTDEEVQRELERRAQAHEENN